MRATKASCSGARVVRRRTILVLNYRDLRENRRALDFAGGGVHVGKDDLDVCVGDQGIMFGCASDETEVTIPLPHLMRARSGKKLNDVRKNGDRMGLCPDG